MVEICDICGGPECVDDMAGILRSAGGYRGGMHNPGGVQLNFDDGSIQISAWCDSCDLKTVEKVLRERRGCGRVFGTTLPPCTTPHKDALLDAGLLPDSSMGVDYTNMLQGDYTMKPKEGK